VDIEMGKGEHKKGGKYPTPNQKVPMMVLPDGTQLGESVAICRYVEEALGDSGLLFGREPVERALIEMWQRRVELELLSGAVGKAWINGPVLEGLRKARGLEGHDSELQLGLGAAQSFYREMDQVLSGRSYLAGQSFSIADITLLCVLDFGAGPVRVPTRWTELPHLTAWHKRVSERPSVQQAHPDPYIKGEQRYGEYKDNGVWRPRL
jgi:glutathione S-transferase